MNKKGKTGKLVRKIHIYGGLFSVGFLLIFSYSAFVHQHHPKFAEPKERYIASWEASFEKPDIDEAVPFKHAIRDSLGLFGHTPFWKDYRDSTGTHRFMISRPGKSYWVTVPNEGNVFKVNEHRPGFLNLLNQMHPLSAGMENAGDTPLFVSFWRFIALPMGVILLAVVILSVHFWLTRSIKKRRSWFIVGIFAFIPLILFVFIWLVG